MPETPEHKMTIEELMAEVQRLRAANEGMLPEPAGTPETVYPKVYTEEELAQKQVYQERARELWEQYPNWYNAPDKKKRDGERSRLHEAIRKTVVSNHIEEYTKLIQEAHAERGWPPPAANHYESLERARMHYSETREEREARKAEEKEKLRQERQERAAMARAVKQQQTRASRIANFLKEDPQGTLEILRKFIDEATPEGE
jgi:hypothetical protein